MAEFNLKTTISHKISLAQILLVILLASSLPTAYAEGSVQELLDKMSRTLEMGSYQGTFVLMHDESVETMQITHGYSSAGVKEKLVSLTGDAREVIRDQDVVTCIWPKDKLVVIEVARTRRGLPSSFLLENVNELTSHYKVTEAGLARAAGLNCKIIRFEPLDKLRYGHELCVSTEFGMLLASKTFDASNKVIEKMMFTSFQMLQSVPDTLFEPGVQLNDYTWKTANTGLDGRLQPDQAWKIKNLPPGFSLSSVTRRLISASKKPVQHMVLTDGLASISIFISKVDRLQPFHHGAHNKGVINAYTRNLNQHQITVVGEVPEGTVKMIGLSISYSRP